MCDVAFHALLSIEIAFRYIIANNVITIMRCLLTKIFESYFLHHIMFIYVMYTYSILFSIQLMSDNNNASVEHHGVLPTVCMDNEPEPSRGDSS